MPKAISSSVQIPSWIDFVVSVLALFLFAVCTFLGILILGKGSDSFGAAVLFLLPALIILPRAIWTTRALYSLAVTASSPISTAEVINVESVHLALPTFRAGYSPRHPFITLQTSEGTRGVILFKQQADAHRLLSQRVRVRLHGPDVIIVSLEDGSRYERFVE